MHCYADGGFIVFLMHYTQMGYFEFIVAHNTAAGTPELITFLSAVNVLNCRATVRSKTQIVLL